MIRGGSRERRRIVKKLMLFLAMLAIVMMVAVAPAMAQEKGKGKDKGGKKEKMKEMPKTGGVPINASLLGLGAGVMLVGGGLLVRKVTR